MRLINLATEAMCLYKGTFVATLSAVDAVYEKSSYVRKIRGLPDYLQDLYRRSTKGLDQENAKVVKQLLMKYSNLFAATDADLGRTKVTEHTINTGLATPIKQNPRRLPVHMHEEVDCHVKEMLERVAMPSLKFAQCIGGFTPPWCGGVASIRMSSVCSVEHNPAALQLVTTT